MTDKLHSRISKLEEMISIQKDCVDPVLNPNASPLSSSYMHGMLNGMIYSHSLVSDTQPEFYEMPERTRRNRVRYKGKK